MAKNYSFEKGKYGLNTGTIIPFGVTLSGNTPSGLDWTNLVPAGFLRCDGRILRAKDYLGLSQILGVGLNCKFRKENQELEEPNEDLSEGEIQLPDLGSKYMRASTANGLYNNIIVVDPETSRQFSRVGVEVDLSLNQGNSIEVFYSGEFITPTLPIGFSPSSNFVSTLPSSTGVGTVSDDQYLSHGHYSNAVITWRNEGLNSANDNNIVVTGSSPILDRDIGVGGRVDGDKNLNNATGINVTPVELTTQAAGSSLETQHTHSVAKSPVSKSLSSNITSYGIPAENIITTVNLTSKKIYKLDDIQHKFIIVEFLIKI